MRDWNHVHLRVNVPIDTPNEKDKVIVIKAYRGSTPPASHRPMKQQDENGFY
jgi:hypothetical protein